MPRELSKQEQNFLTSCEMAIEDLRVHHKTTELEVDFYQKMLAYAERQNRIAKSRLDHEIQAFEITKELYR